MICNYNYNYQSLKANSSGKGSEFVHSNPKVKWQLKCKAKRLKRKEQGGKLGTTRSEKKEKRNVEMVGKGKTTTAAVEGKPRTKAHLRRRQQQLPQLTREKNETMKNGKKLASTKTHKMKAAMV